MKEWLEWKIIGRVELSGCGSKAFGRGCGQGPDRGLSTEGGGGEESRFLLELGRNSDVRLGRSRRLRKSSEIREVARFGERYRGSLLALHVLPREKDARAVGWRAAFIAGRRVGGAVARNRMKRLLREAFRVSQHEIPAGFDYLIMICPQWPKKVCEESEPKTAIKRLKFEQVRDSILALINNATKMKG